MDAHLWKGIIHNGSRLTHYVSPWRPRKAYNSRVLAEPFFFYFLLQGTPTGTMESVPGFVPAFKANVNFGADWLSFDPDGKHARIDLKGMARFAISWSTIAS